MASLLWITLCIQFNIRHIELRSGGHRQTLHSIFSSVCHNNLFSFRVGYISPVFYLHLFRLPWNQHTFMGWMAESTYITTGICAYFLSNNSLLAYFIATCLYHRAYCYTLKSLLNQLDDKTFTSRPKLKILLKDIIQLHSTAKDVFYQSADLFSIFILILLGGGMIFMACCMFQTDLVCISIRNKELEPFILFHSF